jgi:hypothetical protein
MNSHLNRHAATVLMGAVAVVGLRTPASAQRQTPAPLVVRCGTLIHPHSRQVQKNVAIQTANGKIIRVWLLWNDG